MNTKLCYLYRDGNNYKRCREIIFAGTAEGTVDKIKVSLLDGENFIARQVGFPDAFHWVESPGETRYPYDQSSDHSWHEFSSAEETKDTPTDPRTIGDILLAFQKAKLEGWQEYDPEESPDNKESFYDTLRQS